ncbi:hypothetical protein GE061_010304 [Apolygus lucorum]|uniref:Myrosinase 1 n=1 Tax=Apolygus lucorum TaxID=248454 RepID=A0A8S9Y4P7_APOLU|nr:hypothetical protein GE061_010304 [Apolygus lucorum]
MAQHTVVGSRMSYLSLTLILAFSQLVFSDDKLPIAAHTMFPKGFMFGAATAAYQVEGGWNADGKGMSVWDNYTHEHPDFVALNENADVSDDSYHLYKEDVQLLKTIGFQVYRFSISWPRVLPNGRTSYVNQAGIDYYMNLIDDLLANGIEPMVTLFHWDLPQALEDIGGWLNPDIAQLFEEYADLMFKTYGDKVKWWITINEPFSVVWFYGGNSAGAPNLNLHGTGDYLSGHNLLRAHGKAYRLYQKKYSHQGGKLSMAFCGPMCQPKTDSKDDIAAAERCYQFSYGWFAHPVFRGDYPPVMRELVDKNSKEEGRTVSRLPYFTEEEIKEINGTVDFFGMNYYTTNLINDGVIGDFPSVTRDAHYLTSFDPSWPSSEADWLKIVPQGIRLLAKKVKEEYNNPTLIVTENGYPQASMDDYERISYFESHFSELRRAIYEDKCNIIGHTTWSIIDNFEWRKGYTNKFGVVSVDFNDPKRTRTLRRSAEWLQHYLAMHKLIQ